MVTLTPAGTPAPATELQEQKTALEKYRSIPFDFDSIQSGDLVLRTGTSFFSDELRKFSQREAKYSHCGWIVRDENGKLSVYHAIGGSDNPENYIRKDNLAAFFNPNEISGFAIYRYDLDKNQIAEASAIAEQLYQKRIKFDMKFDLENDDELYCAEFIYKLITEASENKNFISLSQIKGKQYVGIDDLYLNPKCKKIFEHAYN